MVPECTTNKIKLQGLGKRMVDLKFDGGRRTSDAVAMLFERVVENIRRVVLPLPEPKARAAPV